jgi:hypothetical protein
MNNGSKLKTKLNKLLLGPAIMDWSLNRLDSDLFDSLISKSILDVDELIVLTSSRWLVVSAMLTSR